jgi:hypothetical protein
MSAINNSNLRINEDWKPGEELVDPLQDAAQEVQVHSQQLPNHSGHHNSGHPKAANLVVKLLSKIQFTSCCVDLMHYAENCSAYYITKKSNFKRKLTSADSSESITTTITYRPYYYSSSAAKSLGCWIGERQMDDVWLHTAKEELNDEDLPDDLPDLESTSICLTDVV